MDMSQAEIYGLLLHLRDKIAEHEAAMKRFAEYVERERQSAIMLVGQADDVLGRERTIPKHRDRRAK